MCVCVCVCVCVCSIYVIIYMHVAFYMQYIYSKTLYSFSFFIILPHYISERNIALFDLTTVSFRISLMPDLQLAFDHANSL